MTFIQRKCTKERRSMHYSKCGGIGIHSLKEHLGNNVTMNFTEWTYGVEYWGAALSEILEWKYQKVYLFFYNTTPNFHAQDNHANIVHPTLYGYDRISPCVTKLYTTILSSCFQGYYMSCTLTASHTKIFGRYNWKQTWIWN